MDAPSHIIGESSATYEGWRIVAVCFLVATFGWSFGFYGQSVYLAELNRLHGWPASLVSAATTFFYLFGAVLVAFVSEAVRSFGPRNCLLAGIITLAAGGIMIGAGCFALAALCRERGTCVRLGWHQPRHHHYDARSVVRQQTRHGDQPRAQWRKLWRHCRSAAAGCRDRIFRICRRHGCNSGRNAG